jgi:CubicO group peptidase (beta-lactamase class C family)
MWTLSAFFTTLSQVSAAAAPPPAPVTLDAAAVKAAVDGWLEPYVQARDFSGVILIAQDDRVLVEQAFGDADFATRRPNRPGTRFRIASLSKTFTAAAIEQLASQGKLSLDDHLDRYIGGIANGDAITLKQLLGHASGVGVIDDADAVRHCLADAELLRRLAAAKPLFKPGTDDQYSNEGYLLLAMIVQKVSGLSYGDYLTKNVFGPLGMKDSGHACQSLPPGDDSLGYIPGAAAGSVQRVAFDEAVETGAGTVYSDVDDLHRWLKAVDTDPRFRNSGYAYPYGWGKRNYSGRPLIEQSGIVEGYDAHMALYPAEHIYVVVLSNAQSGLFNRIPHDLEAVLFGGTPSMPPDITPVAVTPAALQDYVGAFKSSSIPVPQETLVQDGELYMHWGQDPLLRVLTPVGRDQFFFRTEYAKVLFQRDAAGKIVGVTWQWPGNDPVQFQRIVSPAAR